MYLFIGIIRLSAGCPLNILSIWCMGSGMQVDWPCNIVITEQNLMKYNKVQSIIIPLLCYSQMVLRRCLSS